MVDPGTATIIAAVIGFAGGIAGLWSAHQAKKREAALQAQLQANKGELDARLEKAKGEIAADLKVQEARLRIDAETELRLRERSWNLLVEIQKGVLALDLQLTDTAYAAFGSASLKATGDGDNASIQEYYQRASQLLQVVFAATNAAPPSFALEFLDARKCYQEAWVEIILCAGSASEQEARVHFNAAESHMKAALGMMGPPLSRWAQQVWNTEGALLRSMTSNHGPSERSQGTVPPELPTSPATVEA